MSGTMLVAHKVGIPIFVTGGVGGVHRGGETCKYSPSMSSTHIPSFSHEELMFVLWFEHYGMPCMYVCKYMHSYVYCSWYVCKCLLQLVCTYLSTAVGTYIRIVNEVVQF